MKHTINGHTKLVCLLGDPVAHSISPAMHNLAFEALGLDYVYLAFQTNTDQFDHTVNFLKQTGAWGFNCTMPCKRIAAERCDELSPAARLMNSVNTVLIKDGKLLGHNTDGVGYMRSVADAGHDIIGKEITLLGSGGAASAILTQASLDGVSKIHVFARKGTSWNTIQDQIDHLNAETACKITLAEFSDQTALKTAINDSTLLVNASSVGMAPNIEGCLIPDTSFLHPELVVSDVIYNPKKTRLLQMAEAAGLSTFNGMYMLLYQGAEAFKIWTGKEMPISLVKQTLFS